MRVRVVTVSSGYLRRSQACAWRSYAEQVATATLADFGRFDRLRHPVAQVSRTRMRSRIVGASTQYASIGRQASSGRDPSPVALPSALDTRRPVVVDA